MPLPRAPGRAFACQIALSHLGHAPLREEAEPGVPVLRQKLEHAFCSTALRVSDTPRASHAPCAYPTRHIHSRGTRPRSAPHRTLLLSAELGTAGRKILKMCSRKTGGVEVAGAQSRCGHTTLSGMEPAKRDGRPLQASDAPPPSSRGDDRQGDTADHAVARGRTAGILIVAVISAVAVLFPAGCRQRASERRVWGHDSPSARSRFPPSVAGARPKPNHIASSGPFLVDGQQPRT